MKTRKILITSLCLLFIYILTISLVGTTFAKYTTKLTGTDSAKVASWGINLSASGGLFSNSYLSTEDDEVTIYSSNKVVAPGASSSLLNSNTNGEITFSLSGSADVSSKLSVTSNSSSIFLKAGTYKDFTTADNSDTFTLTSDYYPIKYTLTKNGETLAEGTISKIVEELNKSAKYVPGTNINDTYVLSWEWDIDENDKADTFLAKLAEGVATTNSTNYSLDEEVDLDLHLEQVD